MERDFSRLPHVHSRRSRDLLKSLPDFRDRFTPIRSAGAELFREALPVCDPGVVPKSEWDTFLDVKSRFDARREWFCQELLQMMGAINVIPVVATPIGLLVPESVQDYVVVPYFLALFYVCSRTVLLAVISLNLESAFQKESRAVLS